MNQQLINNPHTITDHSERTDEHHSSQQSTVVQKELTAADIVPKILNLLALGKKSKSSLLNSILNQIQSCADRNDLTECVEKYLPYTTRSSSVSRVIIFTINEKLTTFGVAPAWRGIISEITKDEEVDQLDYHVLYDLRIIDLQWLHAQSKENRSTSQHITNAFYRELMNKEIFDYELAHKLATLHTDRSMSIDDLGLSEDVQRDLVVYKISEIQQEQTAIIKQRIDVEKDIILAAQRHPRMGKKLIDVMQDRLDQWMSTQVTKSKSKRVMYETYKKITGSEITLSTYNSKFQSLKNALLWGESKFKV